MPELGPYGSVRGARGNSRPYRESERRTVRTALLTVRPEGADHQWRRIPPRELSIDLVADERFGRVPGAGGSCSAVNQLSKSVVR
jgi:hypothetical protein